MIGKKFLAAVVANEAVAALLQDGAIKHLFKGTEVELFDFVAGFVKKHGVTPKAETILAHLGEELPEAIEPVSYYRELMELRHVEFELKNAMKTAAEQLKAGAAQAALGTVAATVLSLAQAQYGTTLVDFRAAYDLLVPAYVAQKKGWDHGLALGWPYLDALTGGMRKGDLISYVGRPSMGKTWQMLYGAHYGWLQAELDPESKAGSSRMFVSMEMKVLPIEQRLAALHLSIPAFKVKHAQLTDITLPKFKKGLKKLQGFKAPFWVVDGNLSSTVADIEMLARQLKPDAIFIDGAYLLQHAKAKDRYARVAENLDLLKKNIASIAPTVCSWQFKRPEGSKKKPGQDAELEDIGYSDAIGQHSSLVLGLFESEFVETLKQRRVKVLKGRNGETGEFVTNFKFDTMDFSQIEQVSVEDMQF